MQVDFALAKLRRRRPTTNFINVTAFSNAWIIKHTGKEHITRHVKTGNSKISASNLSKLLHFRHTFTRLSLKNVLYIFRQCFPQGKTSQDTSIFICILYRLYKTGIECKSDIVKLYSRLFNIHVNVIVGYKKSVISV